MSKKSKEASGFGLLLHTLNTGYDGFCATLRFIILLLIFAREHGFAPIIKLSKNFTYFDEEKSREIDNPWEYYFEIIDDIYDEKKALNVCYADYTHLNLIRKRYDFNPYLVENYKDPSIFEICSPLIREYLTLKPSIINDASNKLQTIKEKGAKILGVHYRGTDYKQEYNKHPVHIDENIMLEEIEKAMNTGCFGALFLATDDASFCNKIKEINLGTKVLMFEDVYRSDGDKSVAFSDNNRKYHHYLLGYEIARDMYTLSLCDGLVAVKSSVGFISNLYKHSRGEEYVYMNIIDHGNNVNNNEYFKES